MRALAVLALLFAMTTTVMAQTDLADDPPSGDDDGDGIKNNKDACPSEPEDHDGFEDRDGCPDKDNDEDGVPDRRDKCPNSPEDFDGFKDEDGCPDRSPKPVVSDTDGDGVPDTKDRCPNKPGSRSQNGCPLADQDRDGVPDNLDRCISVAGSSRNNGCPRKKRSKPVPEPTSSKPAPSDHVSFDASRVPPGKDWWCTTVSTTSHAAERCVRRQSRCNSIRRTITERSALMSATPCQQEKVAQCFSYRDPLSLRSSFECQASERSCSSLHAAATSWSYEQVSACTRVE